MKHKNKYLYLILYLISFLIFYNFPFKEVFKWRFLPDLLKEVKALEVAIDSSVTATNNIQQRAPNVVFTSGSTGYAFGVDSDGTCVYWKTTNGGFSWGSAVTVYSGTDCLGTTIWYDQWTPGDTSGTYIHIVFIDDSDDDLYYERLDTADDSQLGEVNATGANQGGTLAGSNSISITKGTDGDLYMGTSDDADSFVIKCTTTCGTAGNWSEAGTNPMDADEDEIILRPLANGNIMMINWDISGAVDAVRSKVYTDSTNSWAGSWTAIASAIDSTLWKHAFDATVDKTNNNIYFCLSNRPTGAANDILTFTYNGTSWSANTDVVTDVAAEGCAIGYDEDDHTIIVVYIDNNPDTYSFEVNAKKSTDSMSTWSGATIIFDDSTNYVLGPSLDLNNNNFLYAIWTVDTINDLYGEALNVNLIQSAYRFQNDDNPPNNNTNMAAANTAVSNINIGQRLTIRVQLENTSGAISTTTVFVLQFCSGAVSGDTCSNWINLSTSTAIGTASSPSSQNSGVAIATQVAGAPSGLTWQNGAWYEERATTSNYNIIKDRYTEFGFLIQTANAAENTTYYLRLYNNSSNRTLNSYTNYPTLTTVTSNTKRYSLDGNATLLIGSGDLSFYLDDLEYTRVSSSDNTYATSSSGLANQYPLFMFVLKNTNSTDQIAASWEGRSDVACSTASIKLEVYNFNTPGWETKVTNTTCSANTDFFAASTISTSLSYYYSSNWTYWRLYQTANPSVTKIFTDNFSITFSTAGALSLTAPSLVTFNTYTLGGVGYSEYTFATGTEQIVAADSGIGNGWVLAGTLTNWTWGSETILNSQTYFQSDGATSTEPTLIFSNQSYSGIQEGTDNQSFSGSVNLMEALESYGVGTYYLQPTFDLYISNTSTYASSYVATMTLTLAYQYQPRPVFKIVWQKLDDIFKPTKQFLEFSKLANLTKNYRIKILIIDTRQWWLDRLKA